MRFKNREEAARLLVDQLSSYKGKNPLVLGIPRGAVPMAKIIADALEGELGVILVHKIGAPGNEEFAVGAIGLSGQIQIQPYTASLGIPAQYIEAEAKKQLELLKARQTQYHLPSPNYENRIVIIIDDGIATGATTLSAVQEARFHHPEKIIVAAAVASRDSANKLREAADDLVVLDEPINFSAVGQFFYDFSQVDDEEVINILKNN